MVSYLVHILTLFNYLLYHPQILEAYNPHRSLYSASSFTFTLREISHRGWERGVPQ